MRATSLNAMFCAESFGAAAIATQCRSRCGYWIAHDSACMPPSEPPMTAAQRSMPSTSATRACACTQSSTVTTGKRAPYGAPLAGSIDIGPVEPKHEPRLLTPTTKKRSVSTGLPGPTMLSHQPDLCGIVGVDAGDVMRGVQRMADQHRIAVVGIEPAVGFDRQFISGDRCAAASVRAVRRTASSAA